MQQSSPIPPSPAASSFAGLLAAFASPRSAAADEDTLWNSSDLGDDVASLSYERALRTHARYRAADSGDGSLRTGGPRIDTATGSDGAADSMAPETVREIAKGIAPDRDLRSASITIRLSKTECMRLRARAAEAGLTISAYLRSCALEAETLRAEVKKTLAELKTAAATAAPVAQARKTRFGWIGRFTRR